MKFFLRFRIREKHVMNSLTVIENQDEVIASKLLALKANKDSEFGINKKGIGDNAGMKGLAAVGSLAYASIFPTTSVMINWHQNQLAYIKVTELKFKKHIFYISNFHLDLA